MRATPVERDLLMRWEDERYVRFYTRDTPEWKALTWHARGLFGLILRAVDRAGVLKVGKLGPKGVAVAIQAPWVEVEQALAELLSDGCVRFNPDQTALFIPNYLEAQECAQSDRARKRASRERAAAAFGGTLDASEKARMVIQQVSPDSGTVVPNRDSMPSQNVTPTVTIGHERSQVVTPTHAVPCRAKPKEEKPCVEPETAPASTQPIRDKKPTPVDASPVLFTMPCVGTPAEYAVTQAKVAEWQAAFPGVDVLAKVRTLVQWAKDNPSRRKTHRGAPAFFSRNLARDQDRSPKRNGVTNGRPALSPSLAAALANAEAETRDAPPGRPEGSDSSNDRGDAPLPAPTNDVASFAAALSAMHRPDVGDRRVAGPLQNSTHVEHGAGPGGPSAQDAVRVARGDAWGDEPFRPR